MLTTTNLLPTNVLKLLIITQNIDTQANIIEDRHYVEPNTNINRLKIKRPSPWILLLPRPRLAPAYSDALAAGLLPSNGL